MVEGLFSLRDGHRPFLRGFVNRHVRSVSVLIRGSGIAFGCVCPSTMKTGSNHAIH